LGHNSEVVTAKAKASIFTSSYAHSKRSPATKDEEPETEQQALYFTNEEKVVRNHLKLNVALQLGQIVLFLMAVSVFDWAHFVASQSPSPQVYHVSLLKVDVMDVKTQRTPTLLSATQEPIYLYKLVDQCLAQEQLPYDPLTSLPSTLCDRAWALFLAGTFVSP